MDKVLFFSEVKLSPAMRAKCLLLKKENMDIYIYEGDKGEFYQNKDFLSQYKYLELDKIKDLKNSIIYIYGITILIKKFFLIHYLKKNNRIVIEVADLPFRHGRIKDFFYGAIFNFLLFFLSDKLILTSEYFKKYLVKKPIYIFENLPSDESIDKLLSIQAKILDKTKINIGYVGGLRYFEQLRLLIRYACQNNNVNIHFFGEELNVENKGQVNKIVEEEVEIYGNNNNIFQHGRFNYEKDIKNIYESLDLIYSVYDEKQLNVRLALPNKLYESILSKRIILVGENTKLCKEVKKYNIGYGLPSTLKYYDKFKLELDKILANLDSFDYNKIKVKELLEKIKKQKRNLKKFLIEE